VVGGSWQKVRPQAVMTCFDFVVGECDCRLLIMVGLLVCEARAPLAWAASRLICACDRGVGCDVEVKQEWN
jgi:hypothetical protein